jgi:hypothetical protein
MAIATTPPPPRHWQPIAGTQIRQPKPSRLLEYFVTLEIICQLALLSSTLAPFRIIFRITMLMRSITLHVGNGIPTGAFRMGSPLSIRVSSPHISRSA